MADTVSFTRRLAATRKPKHPYRRKPADVLQEFALTHPKEFDALIVLAMSRLRDDDEKQSA